MRQVAFVARSQVRRRWGALLLLAVLVGAVGGLSLSLIAGARRSSTVVDRFLATSNDYDLEFFAPALTPSQVRALPGVEHADPSAYVAMVAAQPDGSSGPGIDGYAADFGARDPTWRLLHGAIPEGSDSTQILVNEGFVQQFHRSVGDGFDVQMFGRDQGDAVSRGVYDANGPRYRLHIAGVVRPPNDIATDEVHTVRAGDAGGRSAMIIPKEFYEAHRHEFLDFGEAFDVRLTAGRAGRGPLMRAARALNPPGADPPLAAPAQAEVRRGSLTTPVDLETTVLAVLGIGLAIAGIVVIGILLRAQQRGLDPDTPALRTLGFTARGLGTVAALRAAPVAVLGSVLAVGVAIVFSGRYPIGIGRELELDRGLHFDALVLGLGFLVIVVLVTAIAFLLGRPRRDRRALPSGRSTLARALAAGGAPADLVLGTHLTFERGRGVRAVPSRAAIAVGAVALAVMVAVGVYVAGVDHLYSDRAAHGWDWDVAIGNTNFPLSHTAAVAAASDRRMTRRTLAAYGDATVDGMSSEFLAFDATGGAPPVIVSGRLPRTASETALGRTLLDRVGAHIGSVVELSAAGGDFDQGGKPRTQRMRVVGEALAPIFGETDVGDAGVVTFAGMRGAGGDPVPHFVLAKLRDGAVGATALRADYSQELLTDSVPARIVNLHRVRGLPLVGILLAGLLGTIVLISTLTISARARSRELAIIRALGLPSRRIRGVLGWQGLVLAAFMLVIGIPIGLGIGVAAWHRVADGLGVVPDVPLPPLVLVLVPLALLVAVVASILPGRRARRAPVGDLLRVE